ncbi:hypothetical protein [Streptacidiphilus sp. P02-A3a]|uniref:hypothetical protein n=1 Tax=Streptacidiphilus sp. P02-A3a TaxID=2704468 RepID=UPI0015FB4CD9|nr:hypothetical protein [Streptacidiphilus sp. P02-A3a]QMU73219.1 hypothetical protein GXP74_38295 [Streptacidiphilus sp. P02-A3a]
MVETADELELEGLDYTAHPGVNGAWIEQVRPVASAATESYRPGRTLVPESAPDGVVTPGELPKPLHQMSNQEFRKHVAGVWDQVAPAHQSPAWVHRPPQTISQYIGRPAPGSRPTSSGRCSARRPDPRPVRTSAPGAPPAKLLC